MILILDIFLGILIYTMPFYALRRFKGIKTGRIKALLLSSVYAITIKIIMTAVINFIYGTMVDATPIPILWVLVGAYYLCSENPIFIPKKSKGEE